MEEVIFIPMLKDVLETEFTLMAVAYSQKMVLSKVSPICTQFKIS